MRGSGQRRTTCAARARARGGAGAGVPFLVGAAAPGRRRKLPQEFKWPWVVSPALNALSVLMGCNMTNICCCPVAECVRYVRVCFYYFLVSPRGAKAPKNSQKTPSRPRIKRPGLFFQACTIETPRGAFYECYYGIYW